MTDSIPLHETPSARITISPFKTKGLILDLCCGGEGVIARAFPGRVVGVDQLLSEIKECRPKCAAATLFIVGDATATQFVDQSFDAVTVFFGLMFMRGDELRQALFNEASRLLKPGGVLRIWDARIAAGRDLFTIHVEAVLPSGEVIRAGYGSRGPTVRQDLGTCEGMARAAGLTPVNLDDRGDWFYAEFVSPAL